MSADYIYVDVNASIAETIKDLQQQKKSTILIKKDVNTIGGILNLCQQGKQIQYLMKDFNKIH